MSELSDIREMLHKMDNKLDTHIAETKTYREHRDKVIDAHSKLLWGNGEPGLEKKVDRLEQIESGRKWTIRAMIGAMIAGILNTALSYFRSN